MNKHLSNTLSKGAGKKMLRSVAILLCLSLVLGLLPIGILSTPASVNAVPSEDAANLITNGDFAEGTSSWGGAAAGKVAVVDGTVQVTPAGSPVCLNQTVEISAGETYELTLKFKWESANKKPYAGLWFFKDTTANANCLEIAKVDIADQTGDWVTVKVKGVAPEGANLLQIQIGNNSGVDGTYRLDDVVLVKSNVVVVFSESFTTYAEDNLPGSGPKGWELSETGTGNHTFITCYGYSQYSGKATMTLQSKAATAKTPAFDVTPGQTYTAEYSIYKLGAKTGGYAAFVFEDAQGAVVSNEQKSVGSATEWTVHSLSVVAPANAAKAYLIFGITESGDDFGVAELLVTAAGNAPESTEPSTEATEPSTEATEPSTEATEPSTEATEPSTEATEPSEPADSAVVFSDNFTVYAVEGKVGSGPKDWVLSETGEGDHSTITCRAYFGRPSLTLQSFAATAQTPAFAVVEGMTYAVTFEGYKHVAGEQTGAYVALTFVDAEGNVLLTEQQAAGLTPSAWAPESLEAIAPAAAVKAYVTFGMSANADSFSVSDLVVTQLSATPDETEPSEPEDTEPSTEATEPSTEATEPSTEATEPSEPVDSDYVFEDDFTTFAVSGSVGSGPKDWVLSETGTGDHTAITCRAYFGRPSLTLQVQAATAQTPAFNVVAGKAYVVSFEGYKHIAGKQNGGYISLTFVDAAGNVLITERQAAGIKAAAWAAESLAAIAPDGAVEAYITFGIAANADSFSVSDLKVAEMDSIPEPTEPEETEPTTEGTEPPHNDELVNGDFEASETEIPGWSFSKGSAIPVIYPGEGIDGSNALKFTNENKMSEMTSELFPVEGGKIYDLIVWNRLDPEVTPSTRFATYVYWYDRYGNLIQQDSAGAINSTNDWAKFIGTVTAPEDAAFAAVRFYVSGNNCTLVAYIDNVSLTLSDYTPVDPNVFEVINGGFEKEIANWKLGATDGVTHEVVSDGAYDGKSLLITATAVGDVKALINFSQVLTLPDAKAIELSVMAKSLKGGAAGPYIGLWFYDAEGNLVPPSTAFSIQIATSEKWEKYSLIQAVPEGAVTVKIEFGNPSGKVLAYMIDDVKAEVYTGPEENIKPATPQKPSSVGSGTGEIVDISKLNGSVEILDANGYPLGWRLLGDAVTYEVLQPADAPDGKNVIQMTKDVSGGNAMHSPRIAVTPGETYELKVMVKDIVGRCIISLNVFDINGKRLDDACRSVNSLGTGKWQMYSLLAAMPENAAGIVLEVWNGMNTNYTCQVDKLRIQVSDIKTKPTYQPTPYEYPTIEELTENLTDVYPRIFFTPEEAKEIKLTRFNMLKTKYGWTWNDQYNALLESADAVLTLKAGDKLTVRSNTGKMIQMNFMEDVNSQRHRDIYLANSFDEEGNPYEIPYTGFGALVTTQYATMMKNCALAYIMTGKNIYADRAIEIAMTVAGWEGWTDEYWVSSYGVSADASHAWMMEGMVAVFDMCHDRMTEAQIKKLERSIIDEGLVPLAGQVSTTSLANSNMMMIGGVLSGCAVILNEENAEEIKPYLDAALLCVHNALDNFAYSGTIEGHYYTDFGLQTLMPGVGHIYRATKLEGIIDHPFLSEILPYWTIMWGANVTGSHPNYSDASVATYMQIPLGVLSKLTHDPLIDGFLINAGGVGSAFNNLIYLKPDPKPEYLSDYAAVIENFGYGALRTGFADDDMLLTLKANDSQSGHNHYDQNSIQFSVGPNWLITDPGSGSYYSADRSFWTHNGHSTILVDGNSQMIKGLSSTKLVFNNSLYSYIVGSAEKAYGADYDSRMLEKFDRHAIQVNHEDKGYYVIIDDLLSVKPREYTWQMYNGARNTFSVDDVEVPKETTAMGNKVSVPMGKNVLNLNFIDSEKLTIGDRIYSGGFCLGATSAATKAHQFMTVISTDSNMLSLDINFFDILNGMRSTVPERIAEGEISWSSSMPVGQEIVKPNAVGITSSIFYRGNGIGDWLEVPFTVEEGGVFDFDLIMGVSDGCCTIKAILDGKHVSEPVDCSGLPEGTIEVPFGEMELEAGVHTIRMEIVGKGQDEDYADGWYLINAVGITMMRVGVEIPPADDVVVTEIIDNAEALAGMLNYKDNKFDFLMWNRTAGTATAGLLNTDAQQASVLGLIEGIITEGFAATNATTMTYDGKVLFLAEKKLNIVASGNGWQIISDEAQTVQLTAVESEYDYVVTVNGEEVETKIENGVLTVAVEAGETTVAVVVEEPEVTDPTDPTDPDATDPTEPDATDPTVAPTEPVVDNDGDNDAALWIVIAIIVVLLAGAATGILLFLKKRKTTAE